MSSLKERKEEFVTGLTGGNTLDIYLVTSISLTSYLVWCVLKKKTTIFDKDSNVLSSIVDFLINWNNLLLSLTIYANQIKALSLLITLPVILVIFNKSKKASQRRVRINMKKLTPKQFLPFKSYITIYRSQMMIITCICILAVDFPIFPRRFAKVETWGTSIMDLGVGSFVFSMGLISSRSFIRQHFTGSYNYFKNLIKCVKGSFPLFVLGVVRLVSVKSLDYQEHLAEYGKHWNFFFTLCALPLLANIFYPLVSLFSPLLLSFIVGIGYEVILHKFGLLEFIVMGDRNGLIAENKEGLSSLVGYFCVFLNGMALGSIVLPLVSTHNNMFRLNNKKEDVVKFCGQVTLFTLKPIDGLFLFSVAYQTLYFVIDTCYAYGVSRRMANLLYVIWVSAYNCSFLFGFKLVEDFIWGDVKYEFIKNDDDEDEQLDSDFSAIEVYESVPTSLTAVNNNSLIIFLVANLLTGLVNMTFNTLDADTVSSMVIMICYEGALALMSMILYNYGIVLR